MTPKADDPAAIFDRATEAFNKGQVSDCHALIAPLIANPPPGARDRSRLAYLQLGCALYHTGDLAAARRLNASLATTHWRPMRYRLALRQRDPATAKRLRSDPEVTDQERDDFRTTAGLHMLWANRYRTGFPLYAARHNAILFPRTVPKALAHAPLPEDPAEDCGTIILEQGLGDVLFHLAHIRAEGRHETARFVGLRKYGPIIRRYFPQARFTAHDDLPRDGARPRAHLAADFVGRGYRRTGQIAAPVTFDTPLRREGEPPVWGICWRGGSGQNRREERHIPLQMFLDLLPRDARFLALQFDMSEAERQLLLADGRCMVPLADITRNPVHTIDMIRPLAGVISVDSANWHMAGLSQVPLLAIMNRTAHWFWGAEARAESAYASASTVPKDDLTADVVGGWIDRTRKAFADRPALARPAPGPQPQQPVFVLGLPRSATSMTMRVLHDHGLWLGDTVPGNAENPQGYFESRALRDGIVKPLLRDLGADPLGVRSLPAWDVLPPDPTLRGRITRQLRTEGYDGSQPWGFKDPKLTLLWRLFDQAFPNAIWVIVTRDRARVIDSLCRTSFMARHSTSADYWVPFCNAYDHRLSQLRRSGARVFEVDSDALSDGGFGQIRKVIEATGLTYDAKTARAALVRP
ncbi:sulfotransferase [Pseudooceanicola onchidii]|uniref:sulfotransferase n=1 Tax=Pseudooceanicola onchidii TaxID=2562279 RepID=UPI001F100E0C|nr:sulfotransferase [Pseudooceanicola onchidii]